MPSARCGESALLLRLGWCRGHIPAAGAHWSTLAEAACRPQRLQRRSTSMVDSLVDRSSHKLWSLWHAALDAGSGLRSAQLECTTSWGLARSRDGPHSTDQRVRYNLCLRGLNYTRLHVAARLGGCPPPRSSSFARLLRCDAVYVAYAYTEPAVPH